MTTFLAQSGGHVIAPLSDLLVLEGAAGPRLYASSRLDEQIFVFDLSGSTPVLQGRRSLPGSLNPVGEPGLIPVDLGTQTHLLVTGAANQGVPLLTPSSLGSLGGRANYLSASGLEDILSDIAHIQVNGRDLLFAASSDGIARYILRPDLTVDASGRPFRPLQGLDAGLTALETARINGNSFLFAAANTNDALLSYRILSDGRLRAADSLGAEDGLGLNTPTALEHVRLNGKDWIIAGAAGSSSLSVVEVARDGTFQPTDHVIDALNTRFQSVHTLATLEIQGRVYVAAAGADDGVSLFTLLPNGRLLHLQSIADTTSTALQNVSSLAFQGSGNQVSLFVSSAIEAGLTTFQFETGRALRAPSGGGRVDGDSGANQIFDSAGNDILIGGAGDDILIGGRGSDTLQGGPGADLFVVTADGRRDVIRDFQRGVDSIDLSDWSGLRSITQLDIDRVSNGATIRFGSQALRIYSEGGIPLSGAQIRASLSDTFLGTPTGSVISGRHLIGTPRNDTLNGSRGDDLLNGLAGADRLLGSGGQDTVTYDGSVGSLRVDLLYPQINTNVARGDTYDSIEHLIGSQGFDNLRGTLENNQIRGMANVDYIFGRRGNDTLEGGIGDDVLLGGVGQDVLIGGLHRDRAQYSESLGAVRVDLADAARNTGEAAGDVFNGIEDLAGGFGADTLYGDEGGNRLFGRENHDQLMGRNGDDYLNGGAGRDTLEGGAGNDTLRGGASQDTFVFTSGADVVETFRRFEGDRVQIDADLWSGTLTPTQVINRYARVTAEGVLFDFGSGHSLLLEDVTSVVGLPALLDLI